MYVYEREVLDKALLSGGVEVTFPSPGDAIKFRQRCYEFRKVWRERCGGEGSPYDRLTLPAIPTGGLTVLIVPPVRKGVVKPLGGPVIAPTPETSDELYDEAITIAGKLLK